MAAPQPPTEAPAPVETEPVAGPTLQQDVDRILSPDETQSLLRGHGLGQEPETDQEQEQATMAAEFFSGIAPDSPQAPVEVQEAVPPQAPVPAQIPPAQLQQAVQQTQAQPPPGAPQPVPVQQQVSPEVASLQAEMELMRQQNQVLSQYMQQQHQIQQTQQQPQQQAPGSTPSGEPNFGFDIPDNYMQALASEDGNTRRTALNQLLNGVANSVAAQMRTEMAQHQQAVPQQVQPMIDQRMQADQVTQDMYGTYPELSSMREYVATAATKVAPLHPGGWSPEYRDAIAEQIAPMVPGLFEKIQANRAQRVGQAQATPQAPGLMPAGVQPVGYAGSQHVPAQTPSAAAGQMLVRDAQGNVYPVQQQQPYLGSAQARPNGSQIDPQIQDIWHTLGYPAG